MKTNVKRPSGWTASQALVSLETWAEWRLEAALRHLRKGDALVVTKIDRLARSVADLCAIVARIEAKGATLRILAMNLDTGTPAGKLMLNVLESVAQFEREMMLKRQGEGIAKAKGRGPVQGPRADRSRQGGRDEAAGRARHDTGSRGEETGRWGTQRLQDIGRLTVPVRHPKL